MEGSRRVRSALARRGTASLFALVMAVILVVPAAPAHAASFWGGSFNMDSGNGRYAGYSASVRANALINSINSRQPAFLAVQETCYRWVTAIRDATGYGAWIGGVRGNASATADLRCTHYGEDGTFGNAVFYQPSFLPNAYTREHNLETWRLDPDLEQREMLCVISDTVRRVVCSAHLSRGGGTATRAHEASVIKEDLRYWYSGYTVFLGVDANATPGDSTLHQLYAGGYGYGAGGSWKEATSPCRNSIDDMVAGEICRSGPYTHQPAGEDTPVTQKIDYLFVTPGVPINGIAVNNATYSGHHLVWAIVVV